MKLIDRIGQCLTMTSELGALRDAAIAINQNKIVWVGSKKKLPKEFYKAETVDAGGGLVTPALVDCHTHCIFAGSRADEFSERLAGESYEAILKKGGGIYRTVEATAKASDDELLRLTEKRLAHFLDVGVRTVEIKSGYGLTMDQEMRLLRLIQMIKSSVQIIPTFLCAHAIPSEFKKNRGEHVRIICEEMLPKVFKENLAKICDVFCDDAAFTIDETQVILSTAQKLGYKIKLHADQLSSTGGAELAAKYGALSADHLEHVSDAGIRALKKAGTVAVLLPGAVFFSGKKEFPPARQLLDAGVRVALSTDCNPGTSHTTNLPLMMTFAAVELKMKPIEIWEAVTVNAAAALGLTDRGRIFENQRADLLIWDAESFEDIPYGFGSIKPVSNVM